MTRTDDVSRRRLLGATASVAALAAAAQVPSATSALAAPRVRGGRYPFQLGVASGSPRSDGFVLWTRLVPQLFEPDGGMPDQPVPVQWQVATDPSMRRVVRSGTISAMPELAHSVHVEVVGLTPGRDYYYRFRYRQDVTEVGRTRTTPTPGVSPASFTFAVASCQKWEDGYYAAYRAMAAEDLDLVLHLGDYVYEYAVPADGGLRRTRTPEVVRQRPEDLRGWRFQYALTKSDPDLQRMHRRAPFVVTWDDHEVANDYAGTRVPGGDISGLRAAAYRAWYEHMPVRAVAGRARAPRVYGRLTWGDLAQVDVLDGRQYRDVPPCGWGEAQACRAAYDPALTMLGRRQEAWLEAGLQNSRARWNVIGSNVMMARLDHDGQQGDLLWNDAWDGFPEARNRLLRQVRDSHLRNTVVVSGDWHSTFVNDIHADFDRPGSPVATEFVATSISSNGDTPVYGPYYGPMIGFNPHIRYFDGDRRGYQVHTVDRSQWRTDLRMVRSVASASSPVETLASFVVRDRQPGAVQV